MAVIEEQSAAMNIFRAVVWGVALGAAGAIGGGVRAARAAVDVGGVIVAPPPDAAMTSKNWRGVSSLTVQLSTAARVDVLSYSWWGNALSGGPRDARSYLELIRAGGFDDVQMILPPTETTFKGAPAWTLTHRFRFGMPLRGVPVKDFQEEYLLIQRRWSFVVVQYVNSPQLFNAERTKFLALRDAIVLSPEPPGGPIATPAAIAVLLFVVGGCGVYLRRRATMKAANP